MKWLLLLSFFLVVPFAHAETYLQSFTLPSGGEIYSPINKESLQFLYERGDAPDTVIQDFGSLMSVVRVSAIFWKPEEVKADELPLRQVIENYADVLINRFDLPRKRVRRLIQCESNWNPRAYNPRDTDGLPAYGLLQFKKSTFTGADIWSWEQQLNQGLKMMDNGQWNKWPTCSR